MAKRKILVVYNRGLTYELVDNGEECSNECPVDCPERKTMHRCQYATPERIAYLKLQGYTEDK